MIPTPTPGAAPEGVQPGRYEALARRVQDLTPGGSEFIEPEACIRYAIQRMDDLLRQNLSLAAERNRLRAAQPAPDAVAGDGTASLQRIVDGYHSGLHTHKDAYEIALHALKPACICGGSGAIPPATCPQCNEDGTNHD